jgi:hypothetical protein
MIGMDKVRIGQIGSYVIIEQSETKILCMVEAIWTEPSANDIDEYRVRISPLGEFNSNGNFDRGIHHFPTVGAELHAVSNWNLERIFSDFSEVYYKVGKLSAFESIDVYLDASNFFGRHAAILGQTGSGKSWTVTSLIQSALRFMPNAHIIIMDLHGEYGVKKTDALSSSPFPSSKVRCMDALDLEMPYWLLTYSDLAELFISPDDMNSSLQLAFLRGALSDLRIESNKNAGLGHITVDSPVYFSLEELLELFIKANEETDDFGRTKGPMYGKFDQLLVRMQSMMNDSRYDFMLSPKIRTSTATLVDLMRDFVGLGEPKANVTVLNLSAVPYDVAPTASGIQNAWSSRSGWYAKRHSSTSRGVRIHVTKKRVALLNISLKPVANTVLACVSSVSDRQKFLKPYWHNAAHFCACGLPTRMTRNTCVPWCRIRPVAHFQQ